MLGAQRIIRHSVVIILRRSLEINRSNTLGIVLIGRGMIRLNWFRNGLESGHSGGNFLSKTGRTANKLY